MQHILNITSSKYLIIFDTDVIVKKDFMPLFEEFKKSKKLAAGYLCHTHQWNQPRLHPFFNIFDIEELHNKNIKYRIKGVSAETGDTRSRIL